MAGRRKGSQQGRYNTGFDRETLEELPPGLDRAVLSVLGHHVGRDQSIGRGALLRDLATIGFRVHDRAVRAAINSLRKQGYLICSTGGERGGYWIAASWDELEEFLAAEIDSRAFDLLEQAKALRKAAGEKWGEHRQISLF